MVLCPGDKDQIPCFLAKLGPTSHLNLSDVWLLLPSFSHLRMVQEYSCGPDSLSSGPTSSPFSPPVPVSLVTAGVVLFATPPTSRTPSGSMTCHVADPGQTCAEVPYASCLEHPRCPLSDLLPLTCFLKDSSRHASIHLTDTQTTFGSVA